MTAKLRVGVVGAGFIATRGHIPAFKRHPQTEVAAICDLVAERARAVADEFDIPRIFTDYKEMLHEADLDIVTVCTPNAFHAPVSIAALEAGAHVLCEKPMAPTVEDARKMVETARRTGRKLTIGFHNRFRPEAQVLKTYIDAGDLGKIYYATVSMLRRSGIPGYGSWFTNKDLAGGGALIDNGVHGLDMALWFMGHPRPVAVLGATYAEFGPRRKGLGSWGADILPGKQRFDVEDLAAAMVRFENGATLMLETSWAGYSSGTQRLRVLGREAGAEIELSYPIDQGRLRLFADMHERPVEILPDLGRPTLSPNDIQVESFVSAILNDTEPYTTPEQGLMATQVIEGIYQSAESGQPFVWD